MLYYYPSFHLYQRQEYNPYPWTYPGSSPYVYERPPFFNSPCYRECIRSGADSYSAAISVVSVKKKDL